MNIKTNLKEKKAITLIALVVTIIVLLILAGVSIAMLTGDNGILTRASDAKTKTEIAQLEEVARMAYTARLTKGENATLDNIKSDLIADGYEVEGPLGEGEEVINNVTLENEVTVINGGIETVQLVLQKGEAEGRYFTKVNGNYYEITMNTEGDLKVSSEETDISSIGSDSSSESPTIMLTVVATNENINVTNEGETVTIEGKAEGTASLDVTVNGKKYTNIGNITVTGLTENVAGIYVGTTEYTESNVLTLDGAILLSPLQYVEGTATTYPSTEANKKFLWSSNNEEVAVVTSEGILKCGTKTSTNGEAAIITCKGANGEKKCKVTSNSRIVSIENKDENRTLNGTELNLIVNKGASNPTIPAGFVAIDTKDATWNTSSSMQNTDKGLVIMDDRGNQFVWVPVPDVIYNSSKVNQLPTTAANGSLTTGHNYTPMAVSISGNYSGLLYEYNKNGAYLLYGSNSSGNYQGTASQYREPTILTHSTYGDIATNSMTLIKQYVEGYSNYDIEDSADVIDFGNAWEGQLQNEYNTMITNVDCYKGFWMSRYEASYDNLVGKAASIAGAKYSCTNDDATKTWFGLYQKMKDFSNDKMAYFTSSMPWGSQYDAMMNWMKKNGIAVESTKNVAYSGITGRYPSFKVLNIDDMYGLNRYQFTIEASNTYFRTFRTGSGTLANRSSTTRATFTSEMNNDHGSRFILVVQED